MNKSCAVVLLALACAGRALGDERSGGEFFI